MFSGRAAPGQVVMALDLSLKSPAIVVFVPDDMTFVYYWAQRKSEMKRPPVHTVEGMYFARMPPMPTSSHVDVVCAITDHVAQIADRHKVTKVVIEGHAYSRFKTAFANVVVELHGAIKYRLHAAGMPISVISPTSAKKCWTGSGSASKQDMWNAWKELWGGFDFAFLINGVQDDIHSPVNDIVDAMALLAALFGVCAAAPEPAAKRRKLAPPAADDREPPASHPQEQVGH